jgi:ribosomal protein L3 glutamine methyltransferase
MGSLSQKSAPKQQRPALTVQALLERTARRLRSARLHYGHGTVDAGDDAAAIVAHVLQQAPPLTPARLRRRAAAATVAAVERLAQRRISERVPVVYLTQQCWYAGLPIHVDERVLIPRSPIAELVEQRFAPWIDARRVRRIADIGTGSGCIALACARAFARARVDAVDIDAQALEVARLNIRRLRLGRRVQALQSDHFAALKGARYDIIVSNPPYVGRREMASLPAEYRHEPRGALAAGRDGLDSVRVLLRQAADHLEPGGILVVEVGNTEVTVRRRFPRLPFLWLEFSRGGGGVFLLTREQLTGARF